MARFGEEPQRSYATSVATEDSVSCGAISTRDGHTMPPRQESGRGPHALQLLDEVMALKRGLLHACAGHMVEQELLIEKFAENFNHCFLRGVGDGDGEPEEKPEDVPPQLDGEMPPSRSTVEASDGRASTAPTPTSAQRRRSRRKWTEVLTFPAKMSFKPSFSASASVHLSALSGLDKGPEQQEINLENMRRMSTRRSRFEPSATYTFRESLVQWWCDLKEPNRIGWLAKCVDGNAFATVVFAAIMLNGMFIFWQTNKAAHDMRTRVHEGLYVEMAFIVFFTLELASKICVHRVFFFIGHGRRWNIFDVAVVLISVVDIAITYYTAIQGANITFLRICRLFRLSKLFRMFRAFRFLNELRLLLNCLMNSFASLFWSGVLLIFIKLLFGIYFVQSVTAYFEDEGDAVDPGLAEGLKEHFGNVQSATVSLLKATTGGESWTVQYEMLKATAMSSAVLFLCYIVFFMVAVWNIVTSVFIEKVMELGQSNLEEKALERKRQATEDAKALLELASKFDKDGNGTISLAEFLEGMQNPSFRTFFSIRGIDVKDGVTFFKMLSTVGGRHQQEVPLDVFVHGCLRLRGPASSIDLHTLHYEIKLNNQSAQQFQTYCSDLFKVQAEHISLLHKDMCLLRNARASLRECRLPQ